MAKEKKEELFLWEGTNKRGAKLSGEISAFNSTLAKAQLRKQGINPKKIRQKTPSMFARFKTGKVKSLEITIFTRQLSTLINAGIPIVQSLDILSRSTVNAHLQMLLTDVKSDVESGTPLSQAMRKKPKHFNDLYCNLIATGEHSGSLDHMLERIASYREKTESIKAKIKKALFYPTAIVIVAILITAGMLIFVVPQFETVFAGFGAELPIATRIVIMLSKVFQAYWWIIFGVLIGTVVGFVMLKRRSKAFSYALDKLALKLPIIGKILQKAAVARFARTLSTTIAAGLPLFDALEAVSGATGNQLYADASMQLRDDVSTGQQMQQSMTKSKLFPPMVVQMVGIGEESGSLEFMLAKVADFYEEEVDNAVDSLSSLLEPVIMVVLGVLIGGLVIAMYMPIFKLGGVI